VAVASEPDQEFSVPKQPNFDPDKTLVPVEGDCGHVFKVPLARLEDGMEFACPECGQTDSFDEADIEAAKKDVEKFNAEAPSDLMGSVLGKFLSRKKKK
jgi:hypothetical protein